MNRIKEYEELERKQKALSYCAIVLGEILREHPELIGCIQVIGSYVVNKMEKNERRIVELYGKHGEGLTSELGEAQPENG